jgi:hypothetical protein
MMPAGLFIAAICVSSYRISIFGIFIALRGRLFIVFFDDLEPFLVFFVAFDPLFFVFLDAFDPLFFVFLEDFFAFLDDDFLAFLDDDFLVFLELLLEDDLFLEAPFEDDFEEDFDFPPDFLNLFSI